LQIIFGEPDLFFIFAMAQCQNGKYIEIRKYVIRDGAHEKSKSKLPLMLRWHKCCAGMFLIPRRISQRAGPSSCLRGRTVGLESVSEDLSWT